jgi:hypothetical protein
MFGNTKKLEEKVSSTLYDLTHLEINTIIKDEMIASKAPASPRLLLHALAAKYYEKMWSLGNKYVVFLPQMDSTDVPIFRGEMKYTGSGYDSFKELSDRAENSIKMIRENKSAISVPEEDLNIDIMMLQRIHNISDDIRRILKMEGVDPCDDKKNYDFDNKEMVNNFRNMTAQKAEKFELNLDLRQLMVFKKANDIGTEHVLLQTIIGMDGDVTTRISKSFANQPVQFINQMHHEAIGISVDFWKSLITVVVKLGESVIGLFSPKT